MSFYFHRYEKNISNIFLGKGFLETNLIPFLRPCIASELLTQFLAFLETLSLQDISEYEVFLIFLETTSLQDISEYEVFLIFLETTSLRNVVVNHSPVV